MKIIPLAAALLALAAGPVLAQGSVTIAGVADAAARVVDNEGLGSSKSLVSGSNATSRLIVRGVEDLGGGLSASFHLEHGFAIDTGTAIGGFWERRSTVSLASSTWGELRAGRDYVPSYVSWVRYDPFSHVGAAGSNNFGTSGQTGPIRAAFGTNANTTVRSSNAVEYILPGGLAGLEGGLLVAADEGGTAATGGNKVLGLRLGWSGGGLAVSAARTTTENDLTGADEFIDTTIGGRYDFGFMRLSAAWRRFEQASARQTNVMLAALIPLGLADIKASVVQANMAGSVGANVIDANDALQIGLGLVYNLSKRTALYATVSRIDNEGAATFVVPGGPSGLAGGKTSTGYEAGMRHSF